MHPFEASSRALAQAALQGASVPWSMPWQRAPQGMAARVRVAEGSVTEGSVVLSAASCKTPLPPARLILWPTTTEGVMLCWPCQSQGVGGWGWSGLSAESETRSLLPRPGPRVAGAS